MFENISLANGIRQNMVKLNSKVSFKAGSKILVKLIPGDNSMSLSVHHFVSYFSHNSKTNKMKVLLTTILNLIDTTSC